MRWRECDFVSAPFYFPNQLREHLRDGRENEEGGFAIVALEYVQAVQRVALHARIGLYSRDPRASVNKTAEEVNQSSTSPS